MKKKNIPNPQELRITLENLIPHNSLAVPFTFSLLLVGFEELMQESMNFTIILSKRNKALFYPTREFVRRMRRTHG